MRRPGALVAGLALSLVLVGGASADEGDQVRLSTQTAEIGQRINLHMEVVTARGATVEVVQGAPTWNQVEVIEVRSSTVREAGDKAIHSIDLVVAPFLPGDLSFSPALTIAEGSVTTLRLMPAALLTVVPSLMPGDRLELSPLAPPRAIEGAESPLLWPAIALSAISGALLALMLGFVLVRGITRGLRKAPPPAIEPAPAPSLAVAEALLASDPVAAYRALSAIVRAELGARYGFPAPALTTRELQSRMEGAGVGRWEARLAGGLLEECDAVVYAGYRPAPERRAADLTMAREIVQPPVPVEATA